MNGEFIKRQTIKVQIEYALKIDDSNSNRKYEWKGPIVEIDYKSGKRRRSAFLLTIAQITNRETLRFRNEKSV